MEYSHTYFEDEVREGFFISGKMKRAWAAQLEVLMEIDKVCKKYNIKWHIDCGTLLGAVRHGGYIPWDDDMDICMLRDDYRKFTAVAEKELPEGYVLLNMHKEEEDFAEYISRVTNSHRIRFDEEFLNKYHDCPYCIGIDIFPIDYVCPDEEEETLRKELCKMVMHAAESKASDDDDKEALKDELERIEALCKVKFDFDKPIRKQLYELVEVLYSMYSADEATDVALMPYWTAHDNHKYKKEYFENTILLPFENYMLPAPAAYDEVLKIEYGNYMKVVTAGGVHDYPFYNKQECYLMDFLPSYPFKYKFDPKHLENDRMPIKTSKKMGKEFVNILIEVHNAICSTLETGQIQLLTKILLSCQESAIEFGTKIESDYYVDHPTVKILEEYCELIYEISQIVCDGMINEESINIIRDTLNEMENKLDLSITNDILNRKEILFLPFKACYWDSMESVWEAASKEKNSDVYVMPIPYYDRTVTGQFRNLYYEGNEFPEYVPITDYKEYDIAERHPDVIYIQNPFDECNFTTSVAPEYYSRFLKKYTEELIYIPFFVMDEIKKENGKAWFTMEYFCTVPGLIHADHVILQSEEMRNAYIERLTEFVGYNSRQIWENKIDGSGSLIYIAKKKKQGLLEGNIRENIPETWKKWGEDYISGICKYLLFKISISFIAQNGTNTFSKIKESLEIIRKHSDKIIIVWRLQPELWSVFSCHKDIINGLDELVEWFKINNIGILDNEVNENILIEICSAYYGSFDKLARKFQEVGKPVMIMDAMIRQREK